MPKKERATIPLDEFLSEEPSGSATLLAAVEAVADAPDQVRVTPWRPEIGCQCALAFTVLKTAILHVVVTEDRRACCGKLQSVVEVTFAETHRPIVDVVHQQLARAEAIPARDAGWDCAADRRRCLQRCAGLPPGTQRTACQRGCAEAYGDCMEGTY